VTFDGGPVRGELDSSELLWTYSPLEPAKRVYLAPGQLFASADHVQVTTILGSCVAVCLFDSEAELGGVNHFLLPLGTPPSPRFADHATTLLLQRVLALGARNVEVARERLSAEGIPVVAEDTGGDLGRKLIFEVRTGSAWVRAIDANCRQ
jgi:chemotaxis protein CheD